MKNSLNEKTRAFNNSSASSISWSRVAIACGIVAASLLGLLYLDEAVSSPKSPNPYLWADPYADYGIDVDDSGEKVHKLPQLVSSHIEPDSKTINATTGQLPLRKAIVISSYKDQNVQWLDELSKYSRGSVACPTPVHSEFAD